MPLRQIDGEEETASCDEVATIIRHATYCCGKMMGFASLYPSYAPYFASANAPKIRAQDRMPLWKLLRSYFSFGE